MNTHSAFSRRGLLAGVGATSLLAVLTACGSNTPTTADSVASTPAGDAKRTVTDASGAKVEVPANPTKVVTLHYAGTQNVVDLGLVPVGQAETNEAGVPAELWAKIKDVPVVVNADGPIIDKIAALEPDLILAPNTLKEDVLSQLAQIGPVYQFILRGGKRAEWQSRVEEIATVLNKTDAFTKLKSDFDAAQKKIAADYADVASTLVIAAIGSYEENNAYLWGSKNMIGTVLLPLGVKWSAKLDEAVAGEKEPEKTVSFETLSQVASDATVILHDTDLRGKTTALSQSMLDTSMFMQLPAAKSGQVFGIGKFTLAGFSDANYTLTAAKTAFDKLKG